jgi:hypothetical protein
MIFRARPLLFVLLPLCVFVAVAGWYRFMVEADYIVEYEGACDPATESCFIGCEDDECLEPYYYAWIRKPATDVYAACGEDVLGCTEAETCAPSDEECSVTYCSAETATAEETCEDFDASNLPAPEESEPPMP